MLEEPKIKKVDKRDKQLPQNFEQLIEMYDVEKIWPYMKKVIGYINNNLEKITVSPTEPTSNEKVWIQKGKNLSKISAFNEINNETDRAIVKIDVKENTNYVISAVKSRIGGVAIFNTAVKGIAIISFYNYSNQLISQITGEAIYGFESGSINIEMTITTPENCDYIVVDFGNNNGDTNLNTSVSNIQLEQGSIATEYEAYVERKIYVEGEEFLDVEKARNSAQLETTPQTPNGNTKITYMQLHYNNGWVLYLKAITEGVEHSFEANLTQID